MICKKNKCTGCSSCFNICPVKAIEMKKDKMGFYYPNINSNKCINCGLCKKSCPQLNISKIKFHTNIETYAAFAKDIKVNEMSTSGGIATALYSEIIEKNGVVYGCDNIDNINEFNIIRVDKKNKEDLVRLQGSKYVQANINKIFFYVKKDLENNLPVLFIGTPCQVNGLQFYLKKEYENLILIDIICHGVSSSKLLIENLKDNNIETDNIKKIQFRDGKKYCIMVENTENKIIFNQKASQNDYMINFLKNRISRESCYTCNYAQENRVSDITIGDFWGINKESKISKKINKGLSVVLLNSEKGKKFFEKNLLLFEVERRNFKEAVEGNSNLQNPCRFNGERKKFEALYERYGYHRSIRRIEDIKDKVKKILRK